MEFAMHHRGNSEEVVLWGVKQDLYSGEDKSWQAWSTYVKRLGERRGIILMRKSGKDACGCRIVVLWGMLCLQQRYGAQTAD